MKLKTLSLFFLIASFALQAEAFKTKDLESPFASWAISAENKQSSIELKRAWENFNKNGEVTVAVVDTGIDPNHPFLASNIYVSGRTLSSKERYGFDFSKSRQNDHQPMDSHGHGTHIAGIIKSIFPSVKIIPLKYYDAKASDEENLKSTIQALKKAVALGVDIINYSSGGAGSSREEKKVLEEARRKGILVVAAAGNEASNIDQRSNFYFPASYDLKNIITVVNTDRYNNLNPSSNWGKKTADIAAPGTRIRSALPFARAGYLSGTSQATAVISGVAALLKAQFPKLTSSQLKYILMQSATKTKSLKNKCLTEGRVNARAAQLMAARYFARRLAQH